MGDKTLKVLEPPVSQDMPRPTLAHNVNKICCRHQKTGPIFKFVSCHLKCPAFWANLSAVSLLWQSLLGPEDELLRFSKVWEKLLKASREKQILLGQTRGEEKSYPEKRVVFRHLDGRCWLLLGPWSIVHSVLSRATTSPNKQHWLHPPTMLFDPNKSPKKTTIIFLSSSP